MRGRSRCHAAAAAASADLCVVVPTRVSTALYVYRTFLSTSTRVCPCRCSTSVLSVVSSRVRVRLCVLWRGVAAPRCIRYYISLSHNGTRYSRELGESRLTVCDSAGCTPHTRVRQRHTLELGARNLTICLRVLRLTSSLRAFGDSCPASSARAACCTAPRKRP